MSGLVLAIEVPDGSNVVTLLIWIVVILGVTVAGLAAYIAKQAKQTRDDLIAIAPFLAARNAVLEEIKPLLVSLAGTHADLKRVLEDARDVLASWKARQP